VIANECESTHTMVRCGTKPGKSWWQCTDCGKRMYDAPQMSARISRAVENKLKQLGLK
jgi:transposase-like protein